MKGHNSRLNGALSALANLADNYFAAEIKTFLRPVKAGGRTGVLLATGHNAAPGISEVKRNTLKPLP